MVEGSQIAIARVLTSGSSLRTAIRVQGLSVFWPAADQHVGFQHLPIVLAFQ